MPLHVVLLATLLQLAIADPSQVSQDWLEPEHTAAAAAAGHHDHRHPHVPHVPGHGVVLVAAHHKDDISWLGRQQKYRYVVYSDNKEAAAWNPAIRLLDSGITNLLCEVETYLTYIIEEYHRLPATVVFIHSHEKAWHHQKPDQPQKTIMDLLEDLGDLSNISYVNINRIALNTFEFKNGSLPADLSIWHTPAPHDFANTLKPTGDLVKEFEHFLGVTKEQLPPYYSSACCAQFLVSRKVLHSKPLRFWRNLLHRVFMWVDPVSNNSRAIPFIMEWLWFYIFTGLNDEYEYMLKKAYIIQDAS